MNKTISLNRQCKFLLWANVLALLCCILCTIQNCFRLGEIVFLSNVTFSVMSFLFFSVLQFIFAWKDSVWRKVGNLIALLGNLLFFFNWLHLVFPLFESSHWIASEWAQVGNFGADIWTCILNVATTFFVGACLIVELVLVGVDVVWMVKKLAKHIQAKKQKA